MLTYPQDDFSLWMCFCLPSARAARICAVSLQSRVTRSSPCPVVWSCDAAGSFSCCWCCRPALCHPAPAAGNAAEASAGGHPPSESLARLFSFVPASKRNPHLPGGSKTAHRSVAAHPPSGSFGKESRSLLGCSREETSVSGKTKAGEQSSGEKAG